MELNEIEKTFFVGQRFVNLLLADNANLRELIFKARDMEELSTALGSSGQQFNYTLGANQRAATMLNRIKDLAGDHFPKEGHALDVGCGYGGFLIAFAENNMKPTGIELVKKLYEYSVANCLDHNVDSEIVLEDVFRYLPVREKFSLITYNDVLEHLLDPERVIDISAQSLIRGGILAIYAPNGRSVFYATRDPHNAVFGASALPRSLAKPLVMEATGSTGYGLGDYQTMDWYRNVFKKNHLELLVVPTNWGESLQDLPQYLANFFTRWSEFDELKKFDDRILRSEICSSLYDYISRLCAAASKTELVKDYDDFTSTYLHRAWLIIGVKTEH